MASKKPNAVSKTSAKKPDEATMPPPEQSLSGTSDGNPENSETKPPVDPAPTNKPAEKKNGKTTYLVISAIRTHGRDYPEDATIDLDEREASILMGHGCIQLPDGWK